MSSTVMSKWVIKKFDVNNVFLNDILVEVVYMAQPEGFVDLSKPHHICKLQKVLHGLK